MYSTTIHIIVLIYTYQQKFSLLKYLNFWWRNPIFCQNLPPTYFGLYLYQGKNSDIEKKQPKI